jgi:predicted transcriptional regulator
VRLEPDLIRCVDVDADHRDDTRSAVIRAIIRDHYERQGKA